MDDDVSDDFCFYCDDGGSLICCDKCPKVFHTACVSLKLPPKGDWFCPECRRADPSLPGSGAAWAPPPRPLGSGGTNRGADNGDISYSVFKLDNQLAEIDEIDGFQIFSFPRPTGPPNASTPTAAGAGASGTLSATTSAAAVAAGATTASSSTPSTLIASAAHVPLQATPSSSASSSSSSSVSGLTWESAKVSSATRIPCAPQPASTLLKKAHHKV